MTEPPEIYPSPSYDELAQQLEEAHREIAELERGLDAAAQIDGRELEWRAAAYFARVRTALVDALGGEDAVPPEATLVQLVEALRTAASAKSKAPPTRTPPPVRWIAQGPHAGVYLYEPSLRLWAHLVPGSGVALLGSLPPGTEPLYSVHDVELAIDGYRSELQAHERVDQEVHDVAKRDLIIELIDAAEYAVAAADMRHEQGAT